MISVDTATRTIVEDVERLPEARLPLAQVLGRVLARDVRAPRSHPPFTASAMDGYAIRSADTPGALVVAGGVHAGHVAPAFDRGTAVRIFTGAPIPTGADAVVMQEDVTCEHGVVAVPRTLQGAHIRAAGVDFNAGDTLLTSGRRVDAPSLALAAAMGHEHLHVVRRPRIAVISAGDELVSPGLPPGPAQVYESASHGLASLILGWGGCASIFGPFPDHAGKLAATVEGCLSAFDLVVLIGGASVGERDFARCTAERIGARILFDRVAVRPGKPTWFARRGQRSRILGLPGNPAAALVCAHLFLRPIIAQMLGEIRDQPLRAARMLHTLPENLNRETYLRARLDYDRSGQGWVQTLSNQDSSLLSVFACANALIVRYINEPALHVGDVAELLCI